MIGTGDANDVHFLQIEHPAIVLGDVDGVVVLQPAFLRRGIKTAIYFLVAVPDVAHGDRLGALSRVFEFIDDLDVLLATAAGTEKGNADALVGAQHASGAGGGQRQGGSPRGGRLEEISSMHF